jgi:hypothetical protein
MLALKAKKHTNRMIWLGLGLMSLQAGILARMTWFEYSWDIVEPISYFVTYSAVIGVYAYFVLTRKVTFFFIYLNTLACVLYYIYYAFRSMIMNRHLTVFFFVIFIKMQSNRI